MTDGDFLRWIHTRLEHIYGENPRADYMRKLKVIAENIDRTTGLQVVVQKCFDDACKPSGKISKSTALELMKYAE